MSEEQMKKERGRMVRFHMRDKVEDARVQLDRAKHRQERIQAFLKSRVLQYPGLWKLFCEIQQTP